MAGGEPWARGDVEGHLRGFAFITGGVHTRHGWNARDARASRQRMDILKPKNRG